MLHLRLSVDVKCPRHPLRQYPLPHFEAYITAALSHHAKRPPLQHPGFKCAVCRCLSVVADAARDLERGINGLTNDGAEVRWKNVRRPTPPPA